LGRRNADSTGSTHPNPALAVSINGVRRGVGKPFVLGIRHPGTDVAVKSHFMMVRILMARISCLHKIQLQAGRLRCNLWNHSGLFTLFATSSGTVPISMHSLLGRGPDTAIPVVEQSIYIFEM